MLLGTLSNAASRIIKFSSMLLMVIRSTKTCIHVFTLKAINFFLCYKKHNLHLE